jgi:hypothetical protein
MHTHTYTAYCLFVYEREVMRILISGPEVLLLGVYLEDLKSLL